MFDIFGLTNNFWISKKNFPIRWRWENSLLILYLNLIGEKCFGMAFRLGCANFVGFLFFGGRGRGEILKLRRGSRLMDGNDGEYICSSLRASGRCMEDDGAVNASRKRKRMRRVMVWSFEPIMSWLSVMDLRLVPHCRGSLAARWIANSWWPCQVWRSWVGHLCAVSD